MGTTGCSEENPFQFGERELPVCDLPSEFLTSSVPPDAIPSLIEPEMVAIGQAGSEYMEDDDRVLGVVVNGQPRAYPISILNHHEIVMDRVEGELVAVTYCPLTGSGLVFDPDFGGEELDIRVSGLLFANNLVLYDHTTGDVYGPQLSIEGKCSRFTDARLDLLPLVQTSWGQWRRLHTDTRVISIETGFLRNYAVSPYGDYDALSNDDLLFDMPTDDSRPLKERVLAIRDGEGGVGFPFADLEQSLGDGGAINTSVAGQETVVFWDGSADKTAIAFHAEWQGQALTFEASGPGAWTDLETGSTWRIDGRATAGPLVGAQMDIRVDAYVLFWFAWRHFQPDGEVFIAS